MRLTDELAAALATADHHTLLTLAHRKPSKAMRWLSGRLYTADPEEKWRAVEAIGHLVADEALYPDETIREHLRRFFWLLNDESGAVPYGIPEAVGAVLKIRPVFQDEFLPILCSMVTHEDALQTGPIECGVYWALGHVGEAVREVSPSAVKGLMAAVAGHPDPEARRAAGEALAAMGIDPPGGSPIQL